MNTYAIVVHDDLEVDTLRVENIDSKDQRVGIHNIADWLGTTEIGRYEFSPDLSMWFANSEAPLNLVGTGFLGNRKCIYGPIVITTWERRGIDSEGVPESQLPYTWSIIEETITYAKMYADTHDLTIDQLKHQVEEGILGDKND
jgi:hypothetical protein